MTQMTTCDLHNETIFRLQRELNEARASLKQCQMQLAACGVIAGCNTRTTLSEQLPTPGSYSYSASLRDVAKAVTRERKERERAERAEAKLAALLAAVRPDPDKTWWLIERGQLEGQEPTIWWRGEEDDEEPYGGQWTKDANKARRFDSEELATQHIRRKEILFCRATSHGWLPLDEQIDKLKIERLERRLANLLAAKPDVAGLVARLKEQGLNRGWPHKELYMEAADALLSRSALQTDAEQHVTDLKFALGDAAGWFDRCKKAEAKLAECTAHAEELAYCVEYDSLPCTDRGLDAVTDYRTWRAKQ